MGVAEDGRAPTEEVSYMRSRGLCSMGAAEDGRAPTEEVACIRVKGFCSMGRGYGSDLFTQQSATPLDYKRAPHRKCSLPTNEVALCSSLRFL